MEYEDQRRTPIYSAEDIAKIIILILTFIILLFAALLIIITDELLYPQKTTHIINGRSSNIQDTKQGNKQR